MKHTLAFLLLLTIAAPLAAIVGPPPNQIPLPGLGVVGAIIESPAGCGVLRPATLGTPSAQQLKKQSELAADFGLKIYVTQEGWYRITRAAMAAAGFNPGDNFKKLSLYEQGVEQPLILNADSIEFYGRRLDTISTGARTYWLRWSDGAANRLPFARAHGGTPLAGSVAFTYEKRERSIFASNVIHNGDAENYFGPLVWSLPTDQPLNLGNVDTAAAGNATLEVTLQGGTDGPHSTAIAVNGQSLGVVTMDNQEQKTVTFAVPHTALTTGANNVTFTALGGDWDFSVAGSTKLTYQHLLRADSGAFEASLPGGRTARIGGFTSNAIRAIDVTDSPVELETAVAADPAGGYAATITPAGSGNRVVLVFDDSRVLAPSELAANRPSTWSDRRGSAGLLIISNSAFIQAASALVPVRQQDGIAAAVVDVEDLYDEFNFGVRGPEAIRGFLQSTLQWKTKPRWVLLVGDASIDPRNYMGYGAFDFVPTKLIPTYYLKTACDDWLADVNGDGVPDFAIGRLPVRTLEDATLVFNKITSRGTPSGAWANTVLSVADQPVGYDFAAAADAATAFVPPSMTLQKIDLAQTNDVAGPLNEGQLLVDYVGHGSVELWGIAGVFSSNDAAALTNGNRLPFIVTMNCLNGYFHDLWSRSMAEALLEAPNGGAVAVWASSTLTEPDGQAVMNRELLSRIFGNITIGEAINQAKRAVADADTRNSWILFGDPSMKLK